MDDRTKKITATALQSEEENMIEIKSWTEHFIRVLEETFGERLWFAGLQGSRRTSFSFTMISGPLWEAWMSCWSGSTTGRCVGR